MSPTRSARLTVPEPTAIIRGDMAKPSIALKKLAEVGASVRVDELKAELESLYKHFPNLRSAKNNAPAAEKRSTKKRSTMSAAQKKAVSVRMKKYWAGRKAAEAKK